MATETPDIGRRGFLTGRLAPPPGAVRLPWTSAASLASACTGCGACVEACPQAIVRMGPGRWPQVDFDRGECTFCGKCAEACPEPVFDRALAAFPHVIAIDDTCFAARDVVCQSCGDACPEGAIRFRPRLGGPALPLLDADRCSGCGACVSPCPANAITTAPLLAEATHV